MKKTTTTHLTFEEELLAAIYYNNVEKVKWLIGMDYFKPSMITDPVDLGKVTIPLYWLTICYRYMLRYEEFDTYRHSVDQILSIWKEQFDIDTEKPIDLRSCFHEDDAPPVVKSDRLGMYRLSLDDFLQSGARKIDFDLYKAVEAYDMNEIVQNLQRGAAPDAKVIGKNGKPCSTFSLHRDGMWYREKRYLPKEEKCVEPLAVEILVIDGLREIVLYLMEQNIRDRSSVAVETYSGEDDEPFSQEHVEYEPSQEMKDRIDLFIHEIDKPGAILVLFDEGKAFARCRWAEYELLYEYVIDKIFRESKHIRIRVGGYSYRVEDMVLHMVKDCPKDRIYVEHLSRESAEYEWKARDPRIRIVGMGKYKFKSDMDIVMQAEEYDFKTFGNKSGSHTMVYYYVNNIDTGWYEDDGKFCAFYDKYRGQLAITDVAMIKGYDEIMPATAAVCTFTFDSGGDMLFAGGTVHKDRRSRTSSQRKLIEEAGVKLLDLTTNIHKSK